MAADERADRTKGKKIRLRILLLRDSRGTNQVERSVSPKKESC